MAAWMIPCDLAEKRSFSFQIRFAAAVDFVCYDSSHLLVCRASLFFVFRHHRRCGAGLNKKKEIISPDFGSKPIKLFNKTRW